MATNNVVDIALWLRILLQYLPLYVAKYVRDILVCYVMTTLPCQGLEMLNIHHLQPLTSD